MINLQEVGKHLWKKLFVFSLILASGGIKAQFTFQYHRIPVTQNQTNLRMPWAGGLNSVQYNSLDLNFDGNDDLVLFDRTSNRLTTYLWQGGAYLYAPEYEVLFPGDLVSWVLLRDYDCDGFNDLFTDSQQGMRVFRNSGTNPATWDQIADPVTTLGSRTINLFFNPSDIAGIDDLDGDGDLDVLAFNFATGETIDFHQNISVENSGNCGLEFVRVTRNYGGISECSCGDFRFGEPCPVNGRTLHSGGKALLTIDLDNDGDKELIAGEETCGDLSVLMNVGNPQIADFSSYSNFFDGFDGNNRIFFPAAYTIDLDADGIRDLAVSTNFRENVENQIDFTRSSFFYRNIASNELPKFELAETAFLQNEMIDVGEEAHPAFADYDGDGDQDLFIGNRGLLINGNFSGTLSLYENDGSATDPSFELISKDYLSLSALGLTDIKPQFIDLNDDKRLDLVLVARFVTDGIARLLYFPNNSFPDLQFDNAEMSIVTSISALAGHPTLAYIDDDEAVDLLVGQTIGTLEYYRNLNTNLDPDFQLEDPNFLDINTSIERINVVPFVFDLRNDGNDDLVTTDGSGELTIYENFKSADVQISRNIVKEARLEELLPTNFGRISWPVVTDLYGTGTINLFAGTISGGIHLLRDTSRAEAPDDAIALEVFPNPTLQSNAVIRTNIKGKLQVFNISGQLIIPEILIEANQPHLLESRVFQEGIYVIRFIANSGKKVSKRFIVSK